MLQPDLVWAVGPHQRQCVPSAVSGVIEMGANNQQTGLTIRLRRRALPAVAFVSRRAWCVERRSPRSREAFGSNPRLPTESNLQILSHGRCLSANAGERDRLCRENRQSRLIQSGCEANKERLKSPHGTRTKAARPYGCKARQVRLTHAGVGSRAVATPTRRRVTTSGVLPRKADHEKLNDERDTKSLPVNHSRDGAG